MSIKTDSKSTKHFSLSQWDSVLNLFCGKSRDPTAIILPVTNCQILPRPER